MRTVGQILREHRENKLITIEEVEKHTRIRKELIQALERDDYDRLPPPTFVQGFIKNYGKFLNLDTQKLLAVFRRDFESKKHPPVVMQSFSKPIKERKLRITPSRVIGVAIALIIIGFFSWLWLEYRQYVGAPKLVLTSPQDQQSVDIPTVIVEGSTEPEVKVTVNDQEVGVDRFGHFREEIKLSSSVNDIVVTATSRFGQSARTERKVFVKK